MPNARRIRQLVHLLEILLRQRKRLRSDVGNVFADQFSGIDACAVDLLHQEASEGLDAGAEEGGMEGDVDAFEGDGGEASFEFNGLGFGGGDGGAFADDVDEAGFDVCEGEGFHERLDIDFLGFEEVGDVG